MIRWILHRAIDKFERTWDYDASYMRDLIDASPRAAWLFSRVTALGQFRRDVAIDAWCAAGITAVRQEDCGPCTQLGVTMAERAGVSPAVLRAILADDPAAMPPDVALVWRFTRATLAHRRRCRRASRADRQTVGPPRAGQSGICDHCRPNLSNGQIRAGPRKSVRARRRRWAARDLRPSQHRGCGPGVGSHRMSTPRSL